MTYGYKKSGVLFFSAPTLDFSAYLFLCTTDGKSTMFFSSFDD